MANRADSVTEQSSAANVAAIEVTHFALDWRVDFGARALVGRVTLHCTARCGGPGSAKASSAHGGSKRAKAPHSLLQLWHIVIIRA